MDISILRSTTHNNTSSTKISLFLICLMLASTTQAANGPSINELGNSLNSTWKTLLKTTNCNLPSPQDSLCIQAHHGKTITIELLRQPVNALIMFETSTTPDVSGPIVTQQSGFLIGPINGYAYKVVNEQQSHGQYRNHRIIDNGLKVFAHQATAQTISPQAIQLNKGKHWLDGKNEPWIYHWSALARANEALKELKQHLEKKY